jgi:hypothetical protein
MTQMGQQTFVYGSFLWPGRKRDDPAFYGLSGMQPGDPDVAVEILREFGASEFVGKLYTKWVSTNWTPAQFTQIQETPWYIAFQKAPQIFVFDMQGSGPWQVLHFRTESDELGTYVAIALRQFEKPPAWVKTIRRFVFRSESP